MSNVVYCAIEARVSEHADRYAVTLVDLESGLVPRTYIFYDFSEGRSVALTKAAEVANSWCAPYPAPSFRKEG